MNKNNNKLQERKIVSGLQCGGKMTAQMDRMASADEGSSLAFVSHSCIFCQSKSEIVA